MAQRIKHLPAVHETWVRSLGWEDPLEKEMATHSSILAWRIPWTEEPGRLQSTGSQRVGHDWATSHTRTHLSKCTCGECTWMTQDSGSNLPTKMIAFLSISRCKSGSTSKWVVFAIMMEILCLTVYVYKNGADWFESV